MADTSELVSLTEESLKTLIAQNKKYADDKTSIIGDKDTISGIGTDIATVLDDLDGRTDGLKGITTNITNPQSGYAVDATTVKTHVDTNVMSTTGIHGFRYDSSDKKFYAKDTDGSEVKLDVGGNIKYFATEEEFNQAVEDEEIDDKATIMLGYDNEEVFSILQIDSTLNEESMNPVSNKLVATELKSIKDALDKILAKYPVE